jgi:polyphosphate kinase 2 (PPK2 family)
MLVRSGIRLYKYWFSVTQEEQRKRFLARETDPLEDVETVAHRQGQP